MTTAGGRPPAPFGAASESTAASTPAAVASVASTPLLTRDLAARWCGLGPRPAAELL